ncbi:hypothetical protein SCUCBS95973_008260 [Sporothrix curviconia]|uniref:Uncharacterized protein n=1 Tax=Sporothrix curviconia TaxID=1260050 RepID=A0ABP0CM17_9PEZI
MSTNANLVAGQFITSINGKRCTAVSKAGGSAATTTANANGGNVQASPNAVQAASSSTTSDTTASATTASAAGAAAAVSSAGGSVGSAATPPSITNGNGAAIFSTIAAPPGTTDDGSSTAAAAAAGDGSSPALSAVTSTPGTSPETTIAVAGGVIGGLAFLCLVAFLVWFWRRRMRKRRRSTLLTPLSTDPATFGGRGGAAGVVSNGEKGEYVINRGSIGPTPKTERIRATFDYNIRKIKGRFGDMMASRASNDSESMDQGNSQFMSTNNISRDSSSRGSSGEEADGSSAKDRVVGFFGRIAGTGASLTSKFRGGGSSDGAGGSQNEKRAMGTQANNQSSQPDFLTLLGMDERELERAAQNKKNSKKKRASMDRGRYGGSSSSNNDYLGRLNIDFDDPFSDTNAIAHQSAKPAPLTVSQANNPFSDANAVRNDGSDNVSTLKPKTYVADIRRSRGQNDALGSNFQAESIYRDSVQTVNTVDTSAKRNRFRSDPFDLERPELLQLGRVTPKTVTSSNMSVAGSSNAPRFSDASSSRLSGGVGTGDIRRPRASHQRGDSFTSKYSSGVSMGDWSDPGPDVGPSAPLSGVGSTDRQRGVGDSPTKGRQRSNSGESNNSVGKAL